MKKKIDLFWYWFIFVVAFVLCFFVINNKKVNAYHLNEQGDLVSDNLVINDRQQFECYDKYNSSCVLNEGVSITSVPNMSVSSVGYSVITDDLSNFINEVGIYRLTLFSDDNKYPIRICMFANTINIHYGCTDYAYDTKTLTFEITDINSPLRVGVYTRTTSDIYTDEVVINNFMITKGNETYENYIPGGIWYSESNLNIEKEISYEDGYNAGIVANNTAPSFYFDSVKALIDFRSPTGTIIPSEVDMTQYVTGYNSIINISEVLGYTYGSAFNSQYYWLMLKLVNPISLSDTLVFNFGDIGNAPGFSTKTAITFSSSNSCYDIGNGGVLCPSYASFTYEELLQNNFTLKLEDFGELENVSDIDTIDIQLYYNGTRSFGLLTLEDTTLIGDITTDYEVGYRVGFITGEESGVIKGETIGYNKGYTEGYRKASQVVKDPGNNTLVGMVSVLMGMPVNMLISIYDFDFLGINLAEFFFSLITLLVSIWLIKKLL